MVKIKIEDLPKDMRVSDAEMKMIAGGYTNPQLFGATKKQLYSAFRDVLRSPASRKLQL